MWSSLPLLTMGVATVAAAAAAAIAGDGSTQPCIVAGAAIIDPSGLFQQHRWSPGTMGAVRLSHVVDLIGVLFSKPNRTHEPSFAVRAKVDDETVQYQDPELSDACPPGHRVLWNGICQRTASWPPNEPLTRAVETPAYLKSKPRYINVSTGRQLFVDSFLVQSSHNIQTVYHAPQYADVTVNPVLKSTASWEVGETAGGLAGTAKAVGVWWVEDHDRYEMFYRCGSNSLCVAYSDDAIVWTKPSLDNGFKSCGETACNMVVETGGIGNSAVWLDLSTQNSSRRYILAASHTQIDFYTSATGTKFVYEASSSAVEDCTTIYKDLLRNKWVYSIKASGPKSSPGRTRRYWEGDDVLADCHWGSISGPAPVKPGCPVQWMGSDVLDDPNLACGYTPSLGKNNTQL